MYSAHVKAAEFARIHNPGAALRTLEALRPRVELANAAAPLRTAGTAQPRLTLTTGARDWCDIAHVAISPADADRISVSGSHGLRSAIALLRGFSHLANDDAPGARDHALAAVRRSNDPAVHYVATVIARGSHCLVGEINAFLALGRKAPPLGSHSRVKAALLADRSFEAAIELQQLRLPMASRLSRNVLEQSSESGRFAVVSLLPAVILAQLAYEQGDLEVADAALRAVLPRIRKSKSVEAAVRAYPTLARAAARSGRCEFAAMMLHEGEVLGAQRRWPRLSAACLAEKIELSCSLGKLEEAKAAFDRLTQLGLDAGRYGDASWDLTLYIELSQCRMEVVQSQRGNEVDLIAALRAKASSRGDLLLAIKLGVRLAAAYRRAGDCSAATGTMRKIIEVGCGAGLYQTVLEGDAEIRDILIDLEGNLASPHLDAYVSTLLEHWPERVPHGFGGKGEKRSGCMLTPRETDVLRLMSLGQSNKRIALRLKIAPETVKSHAKSIFMRLGSATRAEAVSRATSLKMI